MTIRHGGVGGSEVEYEALSWSFLIPSVFGEVQIRIDLLGLAVEFTDALHILAHRHTSDGCLCGKKCVDESL
ncbi:hypothetical protein TRIP_B250006 [uncultured Desulfatiglans sp.]|nr:hypothetical protein TRIP_B250006 [uncultured Desulfatiglans sp.]